MPVYRVRLFPLRDVTGVGDKDEARARDHRLEIAADLRRKETILFAPQNQRGLPDFRQPPGEMLFPQR